MVFIIKMNDLITLKFEVVDIATKRTIAKHKSLSDARIHQQELSALYGEWHRVKGQAYRRYQIKKL